MSTATYTAEGSKLRCHRHGQTFPRTGVCTECAADPGPQLEDVPEEPALPPKGCKSTVDLERMFVEQAADIQRDIVAIKGKQPRKRVKDGAPVDAEPVLDFHAFNTLAKLYAERAKCMRTALEYAARREDDALVARRAREKRELERGAAH